MSVAASMGGFPEWLPEGQLAYEHILASLRESFSLCGFTPLETRSVETLDTLLQKGETDKEIYTLRRLHASDEDPEGGLGLHFDLTVPFARYVRENAGKLTFPFRRYQIQKAWRGERPQEGRYREFLQADVDVVARGELPAHFEYELPLVAAEALGRLPIPPVTVRVNNRKLMEGFFRGLGLGDVALDALRAVDRLPRLGPEAVRTELLAGGASSDQASACLALAAIRGNEGGVGAAVSALGVDDDLLRDGLAELEAVLEAGRRFAPGRLVADLSIARGLDYYTGTVYETFMQGFESLGSICSGGRYDDLVGGGAEPYPGVGLSIGVTRILGPLLSRGRLRASRISPSCVLVAVVDEEHRIESDAVAAALRRRSIAAEVSPDAAKYGRQIRYAERRGIPFVWFPDAGEVRDIRTGEQTRAEAESWDPPAGDLAVSVDEIG